MLRKILRLTQSQLFLSLLWCVGHVMTPQAAQALTNDEVKQALMDFSADTFKVREAASDKLSKALAKNELTSEQLGFIRVATGSNDLEVQRRAQVILRDFELSIPTVRDIIEATQVTTKIPGALAGQANYGIDSIFAKTDSSKGPFNDLLKLYESARNSFLGGAANDVDAKFKALRDRINGLTDDELKALGIDKDVQKEILDKIDDAIKKIPDAVKTIGQGTNNAPAPMRGMAPVPATGGVVNVGLTFDLSVIGFILPGSVDIFSPDDATSLFSPSPGYRFAGEIFDLLESPDLDLTGSTVSVGLEFGPGLLSGDPLDPTRPVCLARLANGRMDLLNCSDDPTVFTLTGSYQPESKGSGALQLGEFALVQTVPGPGSLVLLLFGVATLVVFSIPIRKSRRSQGTCLVCRWRLWGAALLWLCRPGHTSECPGGRTGAAGLTGVRLLAISVIVAAVPSSAGAIDPATFAALFMALDPPANFASRGAAQKELTRLITSGQLTGAQVQAIQSAISGGGGVGLEGQRRATEIFSAFVESLPSYQSIREDVAVKHIETVPGGGGNAMPLRIDFRFDAGAGSAVGPREQRVFAALSAAWNSVDQALRVGNVAAAQTALQNYRTVVMGLDEGLIRLLNITDSSGTRLDKAALLSQFQDASTHLTFVQLELGLGGAILNNPLPLGAAVASAGPVDLGPSLQVALGGLGAPGRLLAFGTDERAALSEPPPGYQFVGHIVDLLAQNDLLVNGSIGIDIEYGDGIGNPARVDPALLQIVRFANGQESFVPTTVNGSDRLFGTYIPDSSASGLDQFGEFAIVQPIPEPRTILLLMSGGIVLLFVVLRGATVEIRREDPVGRALTGDEVIDRRRGSTDQISGWRPILSKSVALALAHGSDASKAIEVPVSPKAKP